MIAKKAIHTLFLSWILIQAPMPTCSAQELRELTAVVDCVGPSCSYASSLLKLKVEVDSTSYSLALRDSSWFRLEAPEGVSQLMPRFMATPDYSAGLVFVEYRSDISLGQEVFALENGVLQHVGFIDMACLVWDDPQSLVNCMYVERGLDESFHIALVTLEEIVESPAGFYHVFNAPLLTLEVRHGEILYHWVD